MVARVAPEQLAAERERLTALAGKPLPTRLWGYLGMSGPGFLQGALTLGGGSAGSSLFAGALLGYQLLWVQPLAMLCGVLMLQALAHQTLSTGMRPFEAVRRFVHPTMAWAWALASMVASLIWCLPQYSLATSVVADVGEQIGTPIPPMASAVAILVLTTAITWSYNRGGRALRAFERLLKVLVAAIILAFGAVVWKTGVRWDELRHGLFGFELPRSADGIAVMISAFATAVGINMTFLFPYTLLARGWGREHRGLARFDLTLGLMLPYVLATSLVIIATANVIHPHYDPVAGGRPSALDMARALEPLGGVAGRIVFDLGILGMTLSTIPLLMLVCGFIAVELFGVSPSGWGYRLATLIPAPGVLGPLVWKDWGFWLVTPTSVLCGLMLPIAYISFFVLQNRRGYLGADMPSGWKRVVWNVLLGAVVLVVSCGCALEVWSRLAK
ncbi:MAG: divalent metal cation transporter [Planctomycetes bacterium]|nr:divalent metal cation transporter [Planctomycetota bacterium]